MLAAARELGVDEVYAIGGAQAIAALAFGTETIAPVAKIVGPGQPLGDRGEAARLARASRSISRPGRARCSSSPTRPPIPPICAADLLAQAEHGPDGERCWSRRAPPLADAVAALCPAAARGSSSSRPSTRRSGARTSSRPSTSSCSSPTRGRARSRRRATRAPSSSATTAVLGDYAAGSNHVLPTGGLARGAGGLGLEAFLKPVQFVRATRRRCLVRPTVEASRPRRPAAPRRAVAART